MVDVKQLSEMYIGETDGLNSPHETTFSREGAQPVGDGSTVDDGDQ
jgi:hypothetical protein